MQLRFIWRGRVVVALGVGAAGCGRYSISNIRSLKAFQDANNLYKKAEYKAAIERYEDVDPVQPGAGLRLLLPGQQLRQPLQAGQEGRAGERRQPDEGGRATTGSPSRSWRDATDPKEKEIRNLAFEYLIAVYGPDKLNDFSKAEPIAKELIAAEPERAGQLPGAGARCTRTSGRYDEAEADVQEGHRAAPEGRARATSCWPASTTARATSTRRWRRANSAPQPSRTTRRPGTRSAASIRTRSSATRSCRAKVALDYTLKGIEAEDKALALNPSTSRR